jgi:hypothetical protein
MNFGSLTYNSGGAVNIAEDSATNITGTNTANSLMLASTGALTNAANATVAVTNSANFTGTSIDLGNQSGDTMNFGSLTYNSGGAVNIAEDSATNIAGVNTANSLVLTSAGAITDATGASQTVTGNATYNAGSNAITLADNGTDVLSVGGTASFTGSAITVAAAGSVNFGSLTYNSGGAVNIAEDSATNITGANTANSLVLASTGALTNAANATVAVTNNANFTGTSIDLGNQSGDTMNFGSLTYNSGGAVNITEDSSTLISGTNTAGSLNLVSAAAITDATNISVSGDAAFTGTSITLADNAGDQLNIGGNASFSGSPISVGSGGTANFGSVTFNSGGTVNIREQSPTNIAGTNSANSLVLTSAGAITDAAGANIAVTTNANLTGTSIGDPSNPLNTSVGTINATSTAGSIFINEANALTIGTVVANGAGSSVTITNDLGDMSVGSVTAPNIVTLTASSGNILDVLPGEPSSPTSSFFNVTALGASLNAPRGLVGTPDNPFDVKVTTLSGSSIRSSDPNLKSFIVGAGVQSNLNETWLGLVNFTSLDTGASIDFGSTQVAFNTNSLGLFDRSSLCGDDPKGVGCSRLVDVSGGELVLEQPDRIQLEEELKKRLQISQGFNDMALALASITLNYRPAATLVNSSLLQGVSVVLPEGRQSSKFEQSHKEKADS